MAWFDFFKKKKTSAEEEPLWKHHYSMADYRNLVDELIQFFQERKEVKEACFGYLLSADGKERRLFLGVNHEGGMKEIGPRTLDLKKLFIPKVEIGFVSTEESPELYLKLREQALFFYSVRQPDAVEIDLVRAHFEPHFLESLREQVRHANLWTPVRLTQEGPLQLQPVRIDGESSLIFFTRQSLAEASKFVPLPQGVAFRQINWAESIGDNIPPYAVLINPGTDFETAISFEQKS